MSVLNLTFSYAKPYLRASRPLEDLSFKKKKLLLKNAGAAFVALLAVYIYLTGAIVSENFEKARLESDLGKVSAASAEAENAFIMESSSQDMEYFVAQGYSEPKNIDIIRRSNSVAANNAVSGQIY